MGNWSVHRTGPVKAVAAAITADFGALKGQDDGDESTRRVAELFISQVLITCTGAVSVECDGAIVTPTSAAQTSHDIRLVIKPIWDYVQ